MSSQDYHFHRAQTKTIMKVVYILFTFVALWSIDESNGFCEKSPFGHICRSMDLTGFCLQVSQILRIRDSEKPVKPYLQFDKIFQKLKDTVNGEKPFIHFGGYKRNNIWPCVDKKCTPVEEKKAEQKEDDDEEDDSLPVGPPPCPPGPPPPCPETHQKGPAPGTNTSATGYEGCDEDCECCVKPPDDKTAVGTIFSLQDACELKYLKAPIESSAGGGPLYSIAKGTKAQKNPYKLDITEIMVRNVRLHNWLHIRIYAEGTTKLKDDLGKGKIKMAFIIVHDAMGFPVGEFANTIPCGKQCFCASNATCHQGTFEDHIPCMFDSKRVTTNTGMMMVYSQEDEAGEGIDEIHASWRFSQSSTVDNFITELHFKALLVDDFNQYKMLWEDPKSKNKRISAISERNFDKQGMFGWNPVYNILHPTVETLGASDYFRVDSYAPFEIDCHHPVPSEYYTVEPYPDSGEIIRQIKIGQGSEREHCYRLNNTFEEAPPFDNVEYCKY